MNEAGHVAEAGRARDLTDDGRKLVDGAGPGLDQAFAALAAASARPARTGGRLRLTVPRVAVPFVIDPVLPVFRARHPDIEVDVVVEERLVDIVAEGYDAGVRLAESIARDMVQVRLTGAFRFVVVGSPKYLAERGEPKRPEDLLAHECIAFRSTDGSTYAWDLERGRKTWHVPVRAGVVTNDAELRLSLAERGLGLTYVFEPVAADRLRDKSLRLVLEPFAPTVPGSSCTSPAAPDPRPPSARSSRSPGSSRRAPRRSERNARFVSHAYRAISRSRVVGATSGRSYKTGARMRPGR